ncbi:hypothetical protein CN354_28860 [Bacillus cereus]|nr:hypothetical protein CN354_28860 [Bacillus cereus]
MVLFLYGVLLHRYQAKKIQLLLEQGFVLTCNKKTHFFVLGWICFLKLMGMYRDPMPINLRIL